MKYDEFILQKIKHAPKTGFKIKDDWLNPNLFDYQKEIVTRACEHGRYALFMGIGSEGYQSIKQGRKFIGSELKEAYFNVAVKNVKDAVIESKSLFGDE